MREENLRKDNKRRDSKKPPQNQQDALEFSAGKESSVKRRSEFSGEKTTVKTDLSRQHEQTATQPPLAPR